MAQAKVLRIYLDDIPRRRAERGNFNFVSRLRAAFESRGFRVDLCRNTPAERAKSAGRRGYAMFLMDGPTQPNALTFRTAYFYPFWRIERSARRWDWDIARAEFDPATVDGDAARAFCDDWRRARFPEPRDPANRDGSVYVPLQGRLLERRSFQFASPLDMIAAVLRHDPARQVVAGLHPGEDYLHPETEALDEMIAAEPRLTLSAEPMQALLRRCDYVVTENSSVALTGYFLHRPAVLFARIDFHHIAANVGTMGAGAAIRAAPSMAPDYDRYLYWFLKLTAIRATAPDVEARILERVRAHGWQV